MFADSFRHRGCIVPPSGFYEWRKSGGKKYPQRFRLASGSVMGFAGLWSDWGSTEKGDKISCCIITTTANELVQPFHDRMPAILKPEEYAVWLDDDADLKELHALLKPYPRELMEVREANTLVNNMKNEGLELLEPAA